MEAEQRTREANLLLALLPDVCHRLMLDFERESWEACPDVRKAEFAMSHLRKFGPGSLAGARRTLVRLKRWLVLNGMPGKASTFQCEAGLLIWFVLDEQRASGSKTGGATVPSSLRTSLEFARVHCAVPVRSNADALGTISSATSRTPVPALSVTIRMLYHFIYMACEGAAPGSVVSVYSSLLVMCCFASLRVKDAQRATLRFAPSASGEVVQGECFTSKHPKRRAPQRMPFYLPCMEDTFGPWSGPTKGLQSALPGRDYLFPAVRKPRSAAVSDARAGLVATPARSPEVIEAMRAILMMPPLALDKKEAARISGHSLRHVLPTLARVFGLSVEDRNELGRWAAAVQASLRRSALPNTYSAEAESVRVLDILRNLLARMDARVKKLPRGAESLPAFGGWDIMAEGDAGDAAAAAELGADAQSSSESESEESGLSSFRGLTVGS